MKVYYDNGKPLLIVGFKESSLTQLFVSYFMKIPNKESKLISPDEFFQISNKLDYQFGVAFNGDFLLRKKVIQILNNDGLSCPSFVHESSFFENVNLGKGTTIFPFCTINDSSVGNFCIIEPYSLIAHHSDIGNNIHIHSGSLIAGRTTIEDDCTLNFKSSVINKLHICAGTEIGAGSTVTKNITVPGKYVGTPARRIGPTNV